MGHPVDVNCSCQNLLGSAVIGWNISCCALCAGRKPNDLNLNMGWVPSGSRSSSGMALGFLSGWFKLPKLKCEATMDPLGADESLLKKKYKNKISVQTYLHPSCMPTKRLSKKYFGHFQSHTFLTMHNYHHKLWCQSQTRQSNSVHIK